MELSVVVVGAIALCCLPLVWLMPRAIPDGELIDVSDSMNGARGPIRAAAAVSRRNISISSRDAGEAALLPGPERC